MKHDTIYAHRLKKKIEWLPSQKDMDNQNLPVNIERTRQEIDSRQID